MANLIVIGTQHHRHLTSTIFDLEKLVELIHSTRPDFICAEVSPEQLSGETTCNSKPEYPNAIIPYSIQKSIPIIPIQPPTSAGLEWGNRYRKAKEFIQSAPGFKEKWDFWLTLSDSCEEVDCPSLRAMQSQAYDTWTEILFERLCSKLFPELTRLEKEWNERFYSNILKAIQDNPEGRITVTVGIKHKYWLNNRIADNANVRLEHIEDYIDMKDNVRLTTECSRTASGNEG